ncbi:MAG: 16S rRNA (guanine(966)-N(2))-methyltransferase RsmD [Kangiellaceae bacterium]
MRNPKTRNKHNQSRTTKNRSASQLRIIGGQYRGRKLSFESAQGLRPTLDQVRETLFNWLMNRVPNARCLDLFAGSGAIGFEALSRGAAEVTFVDNNLNSINNINKNIQLLNNSKAQCAHQSSNLFIESCHQQFDLVFLDPPYELNFIPTTLVNIQPILAKDALVYIEMEADLSLDFLNDRWEVIKMKSSSRLSYGLIREKL